MPFLHTLAPPTINSVCTRQNCLNVWHGPSSSQLAFVLDGQVSVSHHAIALSLYLSVSLSLSLRLSVQLYTDSTPLLLHTCSPGFQTCQTHLTILPTHSRWLKVCNKTELHLMSDVTSGNAREPRGQARHCGSSSNSSSSRTVSRHGHPRRLRSISAAVETGSYRCNAAVESRSERHNQWKNGHVEQYQHSTSEPYRISDLIPRNWEGNNEKGEFRSFTSDLH